MGRRRIGTVKALWRYPVKSMRGEALETAHVSERGIAGDRAWAVVDTGYGGAISARAFPRMLEARAFWDGYPEADGDARVRIETADRRIYDAGGAEAAAEIGAMLKREIRFERIRTAPISIAERDAIMRGEAPMPPRDFFDEDVLHLLATGTLAHLRRLEPASDFDPRRFRPNILVETAPDALGFVEDQWLEGMIEIGGEVRIAGARPAIRCAMTIWPQGELPHRPETLRAAWEHHQAYVGVFAAVAAGGMIRLDDEVALAD